MVKCATQALFYDPNNLKCLYRRAQAYKSMAMQSSSLKEKYELLEKARKDLEKINAADTNNKQCKEMLQEVVRLSIEVKLVLRNQEIQQKQQQPLHQSNNEEKENNLKK